MKNWCQGTHSFAYRICFGRETKYFICEPNSLNDWIDLKFKNRNSRKRQVHRKTMTKCSTLERWRSVRDRLWKPQPHDLIGWLRSEANLIDWTRIYNCSLSTPYTSFGPLAEFHPHPDDSTRRNKKMDTRRNGFLFLSFFKHILWSFKSLSSWSHSFIRGWSSITVTLVSL